MKLLILLLATAGLSGCAVYPDGDYQNYGAGAGAGYGQAYPSYPSPAVYPGYPSYSYPYGYGAVQPQVVVRPPPVYIYGSGGDRGGHPRGQPHARPGVRPPVYNHGNQGNHGNYGDRRPWPQRQEVRPGGRAPDAQQGEARRPQPQFRNDGSRLGRFLQGDSNESGRR